MTAYFACMIVTHFARWFLLFWLSALLCASLFLSMCMCMCAAAAAPLLTTPRPSHGCGFSDSGGITRKSVAMSLVLSPMKRVQSSPNLGAGTNTYWHSLSQHGSGRSTRRNVLLLNDSVLTAADFFFFLLNLWLFGQLDVHLYFLWVPVVFARLHSGLVPPAFRRYSRVITICAVHESRQVRQSQAFWKH